MGTKTVVDIITLPWTAEEIEKKMAEGWMPGHPPQDYEGSVADWCIAMAERGYPEQYKDLCCILIPGEVWWSVLRECEGD